MVDIFKIKYQETDAKRPRKKKQMKFRKREVGTSKII